MCVKRCLRAFEDASLLSLEACEKVATQYKQFAQESATNPAFHSFDPASVRLDELLAEVIAPGKEWEQLWQWVRMVLLLSNGQASVERGFTRRLSRRT